MNIIVKPEKSIKEYIEIGINSFLLPLKDFSVEYDNSYTLEEIKNIINENKDINIFISINKNIMNEELETLKSILYELDKLNIKAIFFYDSSLIKLKKDLGLNIDLVWSQTHMVANYKTCDYYNSLGVKYALISKEITKDEILEIINKSKINPIVELITMPSIAFSKRKLVSHYFENYHKDKKSIIKINEKISNTDIIVKEDNNGVTFVKKSILNGFYILDDLLDSKLKYVLVKEDFIDHVLFLNIVKKLVYYIDNYKNMDSKEKEEFLDKQMKLIGEDSGFFFKKTIYRVKK